MACAVNAALEGRYNRFGPKPDQPDARTIVHIQAVMPAAELPHLDGETHDLGHKHSHQHHQVSITGKEGIHNGQWTVISEQ
jgi:hypothetical protein